MKGKALEAQEHYKKALAESKDKPLTLIHIGISAFDNGYVEYAYRIFSNLLSDTSADWDIGYAYLARCCYELKKKKEFKKYLLIAIERNPEECLEVLSELYPQGTDPKNYISSIRI